MFPNDLNTWIYYILLAIVLGAVGSGLWEKVFKPVLSMAARIFLRASTFGFATARDSIYKDIARRSLNKPIIFILFLILLASSALTGMAHGRYKHLSIPEETAIKIDQEKEKEREIFSTMSIDEQKKKLAANRAEIRELERKISADDLLMSITLFIIALYGYVRNSYISSAISYVDQAIAICAPYLTSIEVTKLFAQVASISSRGDFEKLVEKLSDIAGKNNATLPSFPIL